MTTYPMLPPVCGWSEGVLSLEKVPLTQIALDYGTPCYVYSERAILAAYSAFAQAAEADHVRVCFAVKANPSLAILQLLAEAGAGFDIVSGGELQRVLQAGGKADRIVFSGVGKSRDEIDLALSAGVGCVNIESKSELIRLSSMAEARGLRQRASIRVNPDIDPKTHPYISTGLKENKFGVSMEAARTLFGHAKTLSGVALTGLDCHIGSQITSLTPFVDACDRVLALVDSLRDDGHLIDHLDLGGGLGITYHDEVPPAPADLIQTLVGRIRSWSTARRQPMPALTFEFGRAIVGSAGLLLSRVEMLKPAHENGGKNFAVVDAAMNDLMRPALYQAWHECLPVLQTSTAPSLVWDLVGPVCESGDWLAKDRQLALQEGDLVVFASAGAYGSSMGSNYNSRPKPPEVLVRASGEVALIRSRQTFHDLVAGEQLLPPSGEGPRS